MLFSYLFFGLAHMAYLYLTTDELSSGLQRSVNENMRCAHDAGFIFMTPMVRQMKPDKKSAFRGLAYHWPTNAILLHPDAPDATVRHEIGHIIDFQSLFRTTHPKIRENRHHGTEWFASVIGYYIKQHCKAAN